MTSTETATIPAVKAVSEGQRQAALCVIATALEAEGITYTSDGVDFWCRDVDGADKRVIIDPVAVRENAQAYFAAITQRLGYGSRNPFRSSVLSMPPRIRQGSDSDAVMWRQRQILRLPNPTEAVYKLMEPIISQAARRFHRTNAFLCGLEGVDVEDLKTHARVWLILFWSTSRRLINTREDGSDNQRLFTTFLKQRFAEYWRQMTEHRSDGSQRLGVRLRNRVPESDYEGPRSMGPSIPASALEARVGLTTMPWSTIVRGVERLSHQKRMNVFEDLQSYRPEARHELEVHKSTCPQCQKAINTKRI